MPHGLTGILYNIRFVLCSHGNIEQSGELDMGAPAELTQSSSPRHVVHTIGKQC